MTVLDIVRQYLESNGFDGLYDTGECACKRDDLAPCGSIGHDCTPGYLQTGDDEFDFYIGPKQGAAAMTERPTPETKCSRCNYIPCLCAAMDDGEGGTCNVCGGGVRYGSRHHTCGATVMRLERERDEARAERDALDLWAKKRDADCAAAWDERDALREALWEHKDGYVCTCGRPIVSEWTTKLCKEADELRDALEAIRKHAAIMMGEWDHRSSGPKALKALERLAASALLGQTP